MKNSIWFLPPLIVLLITSCTPRQQRFELNGQAQGGTYHIVYNSDKAKVTTRQIDSIMTELDNSFSLYNPNSLISRLNRGETDTLDRHMKQCIELALRLSAESGGLYDITVGPLISAIGFAAEQATEHPNLDSIMQLIGYQKIKVVGNRLERATAGMQIDLNSIAQGYTADRLSDFLTSRGLTEYIVEVGGGEIYCRGSNGGKPWQVGLDRPVDNNFSPGADLQTILPLTDAGIATSGNYRKFYITKEGKRVHHTVNPLTGESVHHNLLSVSVIASTSTLADAYGTMFMVMGLEASKEFLKKRDDLSAYFVFSGNNGAFDVFITENLKQNIEQ